MCRPEITQRFRNFVVRLTVVALAASASIAFGSTRAASAESDGDASSSDRAEATTAEEPSRRDPNGLSDGPPDEKIAVVRAARRLERGHELTRDDVHIERIARQFLAAESMTADQLEHYLGLPSETNVPANGIVLVTDFPDPATYKPGEDSEQSESDEAAHTDPKSDTEPGKDTSSEQSRKPKSAAKRPHIPKGKRLTLLAPSTHRGLNDMLRTGDRVDVIGTFRSPDGPTEPDGDIANGEVYSVLLVQNAEVASTPAATEGRLRLIVPAEKAVLLSTASEEGKIQVLLRGEDGGKELPEGPYRLEDFVDEK